MTTSWMWQTAHGVNALRIDKENKLLRWYDAVGCGCGMEEGAIEQTIDTFLQVGSPTMLEIPPDDVLQEINQTVNLIGEA